MSLLASAYLCQNQPVSLLYYYITSEELSAGRGVRQILRSQVVIGLQTVELDAVLGWSPNLLLSLAHSSILDHITLPCFSVSFSHFLRHGPSSSPGIWCVAPHAALRSAPYLPSPFFPLHSPHSLLSALLLLRAIDQKSERRVRERGRCERRATEVRGKSEKRAIKERQRVMKTACLTRLTYDKVLGRTQNARLLR